MRPSFIATEPLGLMQTRTRFSPTDTAGRDEMVRFFGQRAKASIRLAFHLTRDREASLDISQEAIVRAMESTPRAQTPDQLRVWFNQIVVNLCRDWIRRRGAERRAMNEHSRNQHARSADPADDVERRESHERMREALFTLPLELRETVALICIEGYSSRDAADVLGVPDGTLRWRLHEGRKLLKEAYEKMFPKE